MKVRFEKSFTSPVLRFIEFGCRFRRRLFKYLHPCGSLGQVTRQSHMEHIRQFRSDHRRPASFLILPELGKELLGRPCARHFQTQLLQGGKLRGLIRTEFLRVIQPELPAPFARFVTLGQQFLMLLPSHLVHRLVQILAHMKLVMHHVRVRHLLPDCLNKENKRAESLSERFHAHSLPSCFLFESPLDFPPPKSRFPKPSVKYPG